MNRQQIEARLTIELAQGVGFEKSSYNLAPEWKKRKFDTAMKHINDSACTDVFIRWCYFCKGLRAASERIADMLLDGGE